MKASSIIAIIIAILVILGGWYAYATYYAEPTTPAVTETTSNNAGGTQLAGSTSTNDTPDTNINVGADVNAGVTTTPTTSSVTLTANGFSAKSVTIKKGGTVTWKNESAGKMWVASASHPTHTVYDGTTLQQHCGGTTAFDQCKDGTTYSFKFDKVGTWNYHNHSNASQFGSVIVVE